MRAYDTTDPVLEALWSFVLRNTEPADFERWALDESLLEQTLGGGLFLELISADYASKEVVWRIRDRLEVFLMHLPGPDMQGDVPEELVHTHSQLALLTRADRSLRTHGATWHRYGLLPTLNGSEVVAMEAEIDIVIPHDYRWFLLNVAAGGAGPHYGLTDVREAVSESRKRTSPGFVGRRSWRKQRHRILPICDVGCGWWMYLAFSGKPFAEVLADSGDGGIVPINRSFAGWYREWLDTSLAAVPG